MLLDIWKQNRAARGVKKIHSDRSLIDHVLLFSHFPKLVYYAQFW